MSDNAANSRRIAKNTLMLYIRMLFIMGVSFYTSRVVLISLGVDDYGVYNVVGGVVAMFTMISNSLSKAISRFITFELGRGDQSRLNTIFSTSVIIQLTIAVIIAILIESFGVWFLANKMVISPERVVAAKWVLQLSLLTLIINLISIPYDAVIIAHERMSAFAYISIVDAVGKLIIAYLISVAEVDKLILYAVLMCLMALIIRVIYGVYCGRHFEECKFRLIFDKSLLREMFSFAGWNYIGSIGGVLSNYGSNIAINMFCGPAVNAARGISFQVNTAVNSFASNFMTAMNPQITKSYASNDMKYMTTLIFQGAKISYFMLLLLSLPLIIEINTVLGVWLKSVPEHTALFVRLILILTMSDALSMPLITAQLATGDIKKYQIVVGGLHMLNFPVSFVLLRGGAPPEVTVVVSIILSQICLFARLIMLRGMIGLSVILYIRRVYVKVILVSLSSAVLPILIHMNCEDTIYRFILVGCSSVVMTTLSLFYIGCDSSERGIVLSKAKEFLAKFNL